MSFKLQPHLDALLESLSTQPQPVKRGTLDELVEKVLEDTKSSGSSENRKSQWEYLLKLEVFNVAATEGSALKNEDDSYYNRLRDRLDLILTFTEHDACDQVFPFNVLQDLLETQTISSCSHIFSWLESRSPRLIKDMIPQKGKALNLLRMLNDLLRRLSKTGAATTFCGRILIFLSGVFPPGERSGVNLRGEYGPAWEDVAEQNKPSTSEESSSKEEDKEVAKVEGESPDKMDVDESKPGETASASKPPDKKEEFYRTFWSLQAFFARPAILATPGKFAELQGAVNVVFPVIKEAAAKERLMMGSRLAGGQGSSLKRKRDQEIPEDIPTKDYFFAKFLTSPDLLDLEIADTHFRRQLLFQLIILLNHLLTFTKASKAVWATPRNRSLQIDFELTEPQWVQDTIMKAMEELRQGGPGGRAFAETAAVISERERNWVKWKNEMCAPFDKQPWVEEVDGEKVGLFEATREGRAKLREPSKDWEWSHGTEALSEIWEMGYRDLSDLQTPFQAGDVKDFVKKIKLEDNRIAMRQKHLQANADRLAARLAAQRSKVESPAPAPVAAPEPKETQQPPVVAQKFVEPARPSTPSSLHPSLPAKPGSSPARQPSSPSKKLETASPGPSVLAPPAAAAQLAPATASPAPVPAPAVVAPKITDEQILKYEETKTRWTWLALRTARDQYLQFFGRIGTGDIVLLAQEIEKAQQEALKPEDPSKSEEPSSSGVSAGITITVESEPTVEEASGKTGPAVDVDMSESEAKPLNDTNTGTATTTEMEADVEGDVKMEDR
ncbi:hypothetical protein HGRIS_008544 [Hohenbuehelia grisea]|uniref:THO complex subunit 1 n=1 Tax=Hohenbuehelia grisea TaxID=104357 RepID=A0ABR3J8Q3_9AGAR